jgi:quinoprotein glucose dehydrogenase
VRVYDEVGGEMLAEMELPANASGAPMTHGGRQAIHCIPVGGGPIAEGLIAVSL